MKRIPEEVTYKDQLLERKQAAIEDGFADLYNLSERVDEAVAKKPFDLSISPDELYLKTLNAHLQLALESNQREKNGQTEAEEVTNFDADVVREVSMALKQTKLYHGPKFSKYLHLSLENSYDAIIRCLQVRRCRLGMFSMLLMRLTMERLGFFPCARIIIISWLQSKDNLWRSLELYKEHVEAGDLDWTDSRHFRAAMRANNPKFFEELEAHPENLQKGLSQKASEIFERVAPSIADPLAHDYNSMSPQIQARIVTDCTVNIGEHQFDPESIKEQSTIDPYIYVKAAAEFGAAKIFQILLDNNFEIKILIGFSVQPSKAIVRALLKLYTIASRVNFLTLHHGHLLFSAKTVSKETCGIFYIIFMPSLNTLRRMKCGLL